MTTPDHLPTSFDDPVNADILDHWLTTGLDGCERAEIVARTRASLEAAAVAEEYDAILAQAGVPQAISSARAAEDNRGDITAAFPRRYVAPRRRWDRVVGIAIYATSALLVIAGIAAVIGAIVAEVRG